MGNHMGKQPTARSNLHVLINVQDNINLANIANQFVDRKDRRKQTFAQFSQNYS